MKGWNHSLLLSAVEAPGLPGTPTALHLRGVEHLLLIFTLGAMFIWGPAIFLAGLISLLGTQRFLRKAASAKGRVSDLYEVTPAGASDCLFPGRIMTIQFWTEQEESIEFPGHTFQGNPETTARSILVLYNLNHPSEAKIHSFEGLWLSSGLVMVLGACLSLLFTVLFVSVPRRGFSHVSRRGFEQVRGLAQKVRAYPSLILRPRTRRISRK
jgi:hypothetical protein